MHRTFMFMGLGVLVALVLEPMLAKLVNPILSPLKLAI